MAKRKNKNAPSYRFRSPGHHTTIRAGEQAGTYELQVELQKLETPDSEFYCNTARVVRRPDRIAFVFGQLASAAASRALVQNAVTVDVPYVALPGIARTFENERFRATVAEIPLNMDRFGPDSPQLHAVAYLAQLCKILISPYAGIIDFYELTPQFNGPPSIEPVLRIKSVPSVVKWFVDTCEALVTEMQGKKSAVEEVTPAAGSPETEK